ncbi:MAG TPA: TIGR03118 family protein [Actinomycetota bacterium]|nr:TIGR03118 family protein [Actinomycetota bacterium]
MRKRSVVLVCVGALVALGGWLAPASASGNSYKVTKLVSDQANKAQHQDPNLVNAWGLVAGPSTPWWVANNHSNTSTLYDGTGTPLPLVVKVAGAPTGAVFNGGSGFVVSHDGASGPALFLFDTESGVIRAWNPNVPAPAPSTKAFRVVDMRSHNAIFKGLAIAHTDHHGDRLYATDFHNGKVDMFDEQFKPVHISGAFQDPNIPNGYAPFGIQRLGHHIFVTYAKQDANAEDDVAGAGFGFVDMYGRAGKLLQRVASMGSLDAPWGIAWAPSNFGEASGHLLIGNFGDGVINVFDPKEHGEFEHDGSLHRLNGSPIVIPGLWALQFGNGAAAGPTNTLFFTAGPDGEAHGLFGSIQAQG